MLQKSMSFCTMPTDKLDSFPRLKSTELNPESVCLQSHLPQQQCKHRYLSTDRNDGVIGTLTIHSELPTSKLQIFDLDEAAVFAETANRGAGKSHISTQFRDDEIYGHSPKQIYYLQFQESIRLHSKMQHAGLKFGKQAVQ